MHSLAESITQEDYDYMVKLCNPLYITDNPDAGLSHADWEEEMVCDAVGGMAFHADRYISLALSSTSS